MCCCSYEWIAGHPSVVTVAAGVAHNRRRELLAWTIAAMAGLALVGLGPRVSDIPHQTCGRMCRPRCLLPGVIRNGRSPCHFARRPPVAVRRTRRHWEATALRSRRSTWPPRRSRWRTPTARRCPSGHPTANRSDFLDKASSRRLTSRRDKSERSPTPGTPEAAPGTGTT